MPQLADKHNCTGCLACVDTCAKGALSSCYNEEGHLTYKIDASLCIECGLCEKKCPVVSGFSYGSDKLQESTPFAAWSKDDALRPNSSSGGIFASLAKYVISKGGVAIGASLHNNDIRHILIEREEDICKLQGSKYAQSNTEGIYKITKNNLQNGRDVLFSGLGCQIAGLLPFLGDKEYPGQLYTVDLICGGVPSRFIIDRYVEQNPDVKEIAGFRNKGRYEFSIIDQTGNKRVVPLSERPFPLCGFYTELTNRYSCYDCQFNGAHRKSDITIGDYWGDTEYVEEHPKGISVAIAHTNNGLELLQKADVETHQIGWNNFLMHNPRMIDGYKSASNSKARKNLARAFREYPYERLLQIYANKATWHEPFVMISKIWRFAIDKVKGKRYKKQLQYKIKKLVNQ